MNGNIKAIRNHLLKGMPGRNIEYKHANSFHKFKIESDSPSHWLYLSEEVVDDSEPVILINLINIYKIVETLSNAVESKWLYLGSNGIKEVDEDFTK